MSFSDPNKKRDVPRLKVQKEVFVVLRFICHRDDPDDCFLQGVFSTREKALKACRDRSHCLTAIKLDEELPQESCREDQWEWPRS